MNAGPGIGVRVAYAPPKPLTTRLQTIVDTLKTIHDNFGDLIPVSVGISSPWDYRYWIAAFAVSAYPKDYVGGISGGLWSIARKPGKLGTVADSFLYPYIVDYSAMSSIGFPTAAVSVTDPSDVFHVNIDPAYVGGTAVLSGAASSVTDVETMTFDFNGLYQVFDAYAWGPGENYSISYCVLGDGHGGCASLQTMDSATYHALTLEILSAILNNTDPTAVVTTIFPELVAWLNYPVITPLYNGPVVIGGDYIGSYALPWMVNFGFLGAAFANPIFTALRSPPGTVGILI